MNFETIRCSIENKAIYVFGTGSVYEKYKDFLREYDFVGFLDNSKNLINKEKDSRFIYSPENFQYTENKFIIVMSSYIEEITQQLESYGLVYEKDFCTYIDMDNCFNIHRLIETGHFYSPIPDTNELFSKNYSAYERDKVYPGINMNLQTQRELLQQIFSSKQLFDEFLENGNKNRFYLKNNNFEYIDSITYFSFIKKFEPKKIIEIGSGFTSALALDSANFLNLNIEFMFIEPYPDRLERLLTEEDYSNCKIIQDKVQNVSTNQLVNLEENDFLFIDSSHISKVDSDVNYLLFEILPHLKKGTIIHIHDIFREFEYPRNWTYNGRFWNESYLLRAFLQFNSHFEILCFNNYIFKETKETLRELDESLVNDGFGGSIWIRKVV